MISGNAVALTQNRSENACTTLLDVFVSAKVATSSLQYGCLSSTLSKTVILVILWHTLTMTRNALFQGGTLVRNDILGLRQPFFKIADVISQCIIYRRTLNTEA